MASLRALAQGFMAGFGQTFAQQYPYQQQRKKEERRYAEEQKTEQTRYATTQQQYQTAIDREQKNQVMAAILQARTEADLAGIPAMAGYDPAVHDASLNAKRQALQQEKLQTEMDKATAEGEAFQQKVGLLQEEARLRQEGQQSEAAQQRTNALLQARFRIAESLAVDADPENKLRAAGIYRSLGETGLADSVQADADLADRRRKKANALAAGVDKDPSMRAAALLELRNLDENEMADILEKMPSSALNDRYADLWFDAYHMAYNELYEAAPMDGKTRQVYLEKLIPAAVDRAHYLMRQAGVAPQLDGQSVDPDKFETYAAILTNPTTKMQHDLIVGFIEDNMRTEADARQVLERIRETAEVPETIKLMAIMNAQKLATIPNIQQLIQEIFTVGLPPAPGGPGASSPGAMTPTRTPAPEVAPSTDFLTRIGLASPHTKEARSYSAVELVPPIVPKAVQALQGKPANVESIQQALNDYVKDYASRGKPLQTVTDLLTVFRLDQRRQQQIFQALAITPTATLDSIDLTQLANAIATSR